MCRTSKTKIISGSCSHNTIYAMLLCLVVWLINRNKKPFEMLQTATKQWTVRREEQYSAQPISIGTFVSSGVYTFVWSRTSSCGWHLASAHPDRFKNNGIFDFVFASFEWLAHKERTSQQNSQQHAKRVSCMLHAYANTHTSHVYRRPQKDYYYDYYGCRWLKQCARSHNVLVCVWNTK